MIVSKSPFFLWRQRKKQSPAVRDPAFHIFGKREELLGIGMLAMLSHTQPGENGSRLPPAHASRFLNARIAPTPLLPIPRIQHMQLLQH